MILWEHVAILIMSFSFEVLGLLLSSHHIPFHFSSLNFYLSSVLAATLSKILWFMDGTHTHILALICLDMQRILKKGGYGLCLCLHHIFIIYWCLIINKNGDFVVIREQKKILFIFSPVDGASIGTSTSTSVHKRLILQNYLPKKRRLKQESKGWDQREQHTIFIYIQKRRSENIKDGKTCND